MYERNRQNPPSGERCALAKLKSSQVLLIREEFKKLTESGLVFVEIKKRLSKKFLTHRVNIHSIVTGKSWKHLLK